MRGKGRESVCTYSKGGIECVPVLELLEEDIVVLESLFPLHLHPEVLSARLGALPPHKVLVCASPGRNVSALRA